MKGLLGLEHVDRDELVGYLELAEQFVDDDGRPHTPEQYRDALAGDSVGLLFFEPSTRTRASFELAVQRLGGHPLVLDLQTSSIRKGETEFDTCANLQSMGVKAFVIRHPERQLPLAVADRLEVPVLNAGNGSGEHPTQGLLDIFALRRHFGSVKGLRVAIIGDIVHSRVARSDVFGLRTLGADVVISGPAQLMPSGGHWEGVEIAPTRRAALEDADAVIMLRIQKERMHGDALATSDYVREWGVDELVAEDELKPGAVVMHPGPVIRGVELTSGVADGPRSLILKQAGYGVAVRQAVLLKVLRNLTV